MQPLVKKQEYLRKQQYRGFALFAVGGIAAYFLLPLGLLAIVGLWLCWSAMWKLLRSKCDECGYNIGWLNPLTNAKCRECDTIYYEQPQLPKDNDEFWSR